MIDIELHRCMLDVNFWELLCCFMAIFMLMT